MAKPKSEAGKYYNEAVLAYLMSKVNQAPHKTLDILEQFEEYLKQNLGKYIRTMTKEFKSSVELRKFNGIPVGLCWSQQETWEMEPITFDELGQINAGIPYCLYIESEKYLYLQIECPGNTHSNPKILKKEDGDSVHFTILGEKEPADNDGARYLVDTRRKGGYLLKTIEFKLNNKKLGGVLEKEWKNGCYIIKWDLKEKSEYEEI